MDDARRLLLWDIDGTLISTGAAGQRALAGAAIRKFGVGAELDGIEIAGRTDARIARQILAKFNTPANAENVSAFLDIYLELLAHELPRSQGLVLPGVRELLERTSARPDLALGLLTGNLRQGAKLKLEYYGLWQFFDFGAFADDHHDRNELGPFAIRRALAQTGHEFPAARTDVIGDTGHDVACGKAFGARTIAVATGGWSAESLAASAPDFLFNDFANVDEVARTLGW